MPNGYLTENGPRPEFAELYGAKEHASDKYPPRTKANILWAHGTWIFDTSGSNELPMLSRGTRLAVRTAMDMDKGGSVLIVHVSGDRPSPRSGPAALEWLAERDVKVLNVAGNRESKSPGIGAWVEEYMAEVFRLIREPTHAA